EMTVLVDFENVAGFKPRLSIHFDQRTLGVATNLPLQKRVRMDEKFALLRRSVHVKQAHEGAGHRTADGSKPLCVRLMSPPGRDARPRFGDAVGQVKFFARITLDEG